MEKWGFCLTEALISESNGEVDLVPINHVSVECKVQNFSNIPMIVHKILEARRHRLHC